MRPRSLLAAIFGAGALVLYAPAFPGTILVPLDQTVIEAEEIYDHDYDAQPAPEDMVHTFVLIAMSRSADLFVESSATSAGRFN